MEDTDRYQHDQKPNTEIFLELVIMPTVGEQHQVAVMYFRYSDIRRHVDVSDRVRYLQTEIQARHPELNVTSGGAAAELQRVLREWHPNLGSSARYTIQIPGQLDIISVTAAEQAPADNLQEQISAAERETWLTQEQLRLVQEHQRQQQAEQEARERERGAKYAAELERLQHRLHDAERELSVERIAAQDAEGRLDTLRREFARASHNAGQADPELLRKLSALEQRYQALLRQYNAMKGPTAGTVPPGNADPQQAPADPQPQQVVSQPRNPPQPNDSYLQSLKSNESQSSIYPSVKPMDN